MSNKKNLRPGTVDYSKFDNIDCSSSDDEDEERHRPRPSVNNAPKRRRQVVVNDDEDEDEKMKAAPDLQALQKAWGSAANNSSQVTAPPGGATIRTCVACSEPNPRFKCGRCQVVWFCNVSCQRAYHPVHKHECIDASQHMAYWGIFNQPKEGGDSDSPTTTASTRQALLLASLRARQMAKRRRVLKRAAAAAAVRRAQLTRRGPDKAGGKGNKGPEQREETCSVCQCEFTVAGDAGVGLCCPGSDFMCAECAGVYVKSVMGDLEASYPPRCPMCRADMPIEQFEQQLTNKQQAELKTFVARRALLPGQVLVECQHCGFFEVSNDGPPVVWWCANCDKGLCFVCNKDLPTGVRKYDLETSPHAICKELRSAKALVEGAIQEGSRMRCPQCSLAGRKDDACTHMTCAKCTTVWCYVCGLDVKQCDKAPPREGRSVDDIFLHNQDWESNEARCPMYLTQILEVDLGWLGEDWEEHATDDDFEDDDKCLDYFHRFRTIKKLQEVRAKVGPDVFEAVFHHFDSVKNSGYDLDEIISTSTDMLIDREEFLRYREEEQDDEGAELDETIDEDESQDTNGEDEEEAVWEELPAEMTRAVLLEQEQLTHAMDASRASAQEDELVRRVMEDSMQEDE